MSLKFNYQYFFADIEIHTYLLSLMTTATMWACLFWVMLLICARMQLKANRNLRHSVLHKRTSKKNKKWSFIYNLFYPTYFWSNNGNNGMEFELVFYLYAQFLTNKDCSNCIWRWTFYLRNNNTSKVYIDTIGMVLL